MDSSGTAINPAKTEIVRGTSADTLLQNAGFRQAWSELAAACPWSTIWQSWEYAETWLSVYRETYEPLLVIQRDEANGLIGLLPLAIQRNTGAIVHIGSGQAEYQAWLAYETHGNSFIEEALAALGRNYPGQRLKFKYLPPGSPIDWCGAGSAWESRVILREQKRPLLALGPNSRAEESLRKKSNKSRIHRLQRIATFRLVQLNTREELESILPTVAEYCDLRQGAINSLLPFREDPCKKEFWLRLIEKPGLVHASALMLGDSVIAAHIGPIDRSTVLLGIIAHSPFLAEHSPGKLLILLLASELGRQGFRELDLTPGGIYKDRFADHADQVYTLEIYFNRAAFVRAIGKARLHGVLAKAFGGRRHTIAKRARRIANTGVWTFLSHVTRTAFHKLLRHHEYNIYAISPKEVRHSDISPRLNVNCIADLLLYQPLGVADPSRTQFFLDSIEWLQAGARVYTFAEGGVLLHCAWLSNLKSSVEINSEDRIAPPKHACLLWNSYTHPTARDRFLQNCSVAQRLQDAAALPDIETILVRIDADDSRAKHALEEAGFMTCSIADRERRARWRFRLWSPWGNAHSERCNESGRQLAQRSESCEVASSPIDKSA
ncbi:hypothetical protein AA309_08400 [Microvirga vignae]|uniref:BioF2-like acetyltransferase domain-containing protein n=1 Tax=Microvirga vignae TaxID=1225564 RepID=A0A0H1RL70_9HYPH|nr:GNAT family N-acetyltransferase [Microvirga vignae]KLK93357.1 hypothetical protein AA309_08400 [Microvirga vignae]